MGATDVLDVLHQKLERRGSPEWIRSDNGSEPASQALLTGFEESVSGQFETNQKLLWKTTSMSSSCIAPT